MDEGLLAGLPVTEAAAEGMLELPLTAWHGMGTLA